MDSSPPADENWWEVFLWVGFSGRGFLENVVGWLYFLGIEGCLMVRRGPLC